MALEHFHNGHASDAWLFVSLGCKSAECSPPYQSALSLTNAVVRFFGTKSVSIFGTAAASTLSVLLQIVSEKPLSIFGTILYGEVMCLQTTAKAAKSFVYNFLGLFSIGHLMVHCKTWTQRRHASKKKDFFGKKFSFCTIYSDG